MSPTWKLIIAFAVGVIVGSTGVYQVLHDIGHLLQSIHH